jgi:hypothetical protein
MVVGLGIVIVLGLVTAVGLAVLFTIFTRNRGRCVEQLLEEHEPAVEVRVNPYQPSRLRVRRNRHLRPYTSGELMLVVGGSAFVGLAFVAIIFIGWLAGG